MVLSDYDGPLGLNLALHWQKKKKKTETLYHRKSDPWASVGSPTCNCHEHSVYHPDYRTVLWGVVLYKWRDLSLWCFLLPKVVFPAPFCLLSSFFVCLGKSFRIYASTPSYSAPSHVGLAAWGSLCEQWHGNSKYVQHSSLASLMFSSA